MNVPTHVVAGQTSVNRARRSSPLLKPRKADVSALHMRKSERARASASTPDVGHDEENEDDVCTRHKQAERHLNVGVEEGQ